MKRLLLNLSRKGGFLEVYPLVERVRRNVMVDCDHMDARFLSSCYSSYRQILLWVIASTLTLVQSIIEIGRSSRLGAFLRLLPG